jgi:hypothetical protein
MLPSRSLPCQSQTLGGQIAQLTKPSFCAQTVRHPRGARPSVAAYRSSLNNGSDGYWLVVGGACQQVLQNRQVPAAENDKKTVIR